MSSYRETLGHLASPKDQFVLQAGRNVPQSNWAVELYVCTSQINHIYVMLSLYLYGSIYSYIFVFKDHSFVYSVSICLHNLFGEIGSSSMDHIV